MNAQKELSLWQLTNEHQKLLSQLYDFETGEVNELIQAQLNAIEPDIEKKCISVSKWIRHLEQEQMELEGIINDLTKRKKAYSERIERFNNDIKNNMEIRNITKISCPLFTIKITKNPYGTEIIDESEIPERFIKTREIVKMESKPDRNAIKEEVLRTGVQIPGAYVGQKTRINIITDKI